MHDALAKLAKLGASARALQHAQQVELLARGRVLSAARLLASARLLPAPHERAPHERALILGSRPAHSAGARLS